MNPTTHAILNSVASSDRELTPAEKILLQRLLNGQAESPASASEAMLMTQKQAAQTLGVSRVTLWRMTKETILTPVEVLPGTFRYRRDEVESVARLGHTATLKIRKETKRRAAVAA